MRTPAKKHTHILRTLFGFALSLLMLVPFAMIVLNSFKNKKEAAQMGLALPKQWNIIENYRAVMETGVVHAFRNSCITVSAFDCSVFCIGSICITETKYKSKSEDHYVFCDRTYHSGTDYSDLYVV